MDENLKFVLTLAGGAVVAGLFGLLGAWIADKREHKQWLRNHKVDVYTAYLKQVRLLAIHLDDVMTLRSEAMAPLREANLNVSTTAIRIAAPEKVGSASNRVSRAVRNMTDASNVGGTAEEMAAYEKARKGFWRELDALENLMREDLKIKD